MAEAKDKGTEKVYETAPEPNYGFEFLAFASESRARWDRVDAEYDKFMKNFAVVVAVVVIFSLGAACARK